MPKAYSDNWYIMKVHGSLYEFSESENPWVIGPSIVFCVRLISLRLWSCTTVSKTHCFQ